MQTCPARRRRRENSFDEHVSDLLERQSAQGTAHRGSNTGESQRSGDFVGQVYTSLRVFREGDVIFDNGNITRVTSFTKYTFRLFRDNARERESSGSITDLSLRNCK